MDGCALNAIFRLRHRAEIMNSAMTEEEVEEEYRRAGKIDKYDPEMELNKCYARVTKKHPPPDGYDPKLEEYLKLIENED